MFYIQFGFLMEGTIKFTKIKAYLQLNSLWTHLWAFFFMLLSEEITVFNGQSVLVKQNSLLKVCFP